VNGSGARRSLREKRADAAEQFERTTFAQLIADGSLEIGDGYRAKNEELGGDGPIFLRAGHVTDTHIDFAGVERFYKELEPRVRGKMAKAGDAVITTKGNSTGRTTYVTRSMPPFVYSPHLSYWRSLDPDRIESGFLRYWSRGAEFEAQLAGMKASTDMAPYLSLIDEKRLEITLPPISQQRAIAHILGTLDDKIELNRRMNETLEQIARALFKSWFVDFDPVRVKAEGRDPGLPSEIADLFPDSFEKSELGEIPKGWRAGRLGDIADHPRRSVQPAEIDPSTPYIALEHMPKRCIALADWGQAEGLASNKFEFRKSEILFGKLRPYFHKVGVAPVDGVCSTDIVVVAPRAPEWFGLVLGHVSSDAFVEYTNAGSTGTKMPRTSWAEMSRYQIVLPSSALVEEITSRANLFVERIISSVHESRSLASLRDSLLPKLISGELNATISKDGRSIANA
jgi:type I restriction enzyme S subunit